MVGTNQNMYRNSSPSQNTGADTPNSANPMATRSKLDRGRSAERIPMGMPRRSQKNAAPMARLMVTLKRSSRMGFRQDRLVNENPSPGHPQLSPKKMRFTNSPYCT